MSLIIKEQFIEFRGPFDLGNLTGGPLVYRTAEEQQAFDDFRDKKHQEEQALSATLVEEAKTNGSVYSLDFCGNGY